VQFKGRAGEPPPLWPEQAGRLPLNHGRFPGL
jgi:hypothetical protein